MKPHMSRNSVSRKLLHLFKALQLCFIIICHFLTTSSRLHSGGSFSCCPAQVKGDGIGGSQTNVHGIFSKQLRVDPACGISLHASTDRQLTTDRRCHVPWWSSSDWV